MKKLVKRNKERVVKEILADGTIVNMTRKEEREWRKKLKTKERGRSSEW